MMKYVEKSGTGTHTVGYTYDSINNLTKLVETIGNEKRETSYTYDAWGNLITADIPEDTLGFYNPLRYRGYVYDGETELYYL